MYICTDTQMAYLLDLALLESQVAHLLLEVPEITILVFLIFIHELINYNMYITGNSLNSHILYLPHNFLEMQKNMGSTRT